jgi:D-alanine-D-alanine ligase
MAVVEAFLRGSPVAGEPVARFPLGPATGRKLAVTVLCGGPSGEREVSLRSGRAVAAALRTAGHDVREADVSPTDLSALDRPGIDAVFVALHGEFGEDGRIQTVLEDRGIPYTGSGPLACKMAMNKQVAKDMFDAAGLPVPSGRVVTELRPATASDLAATLGLPLVAKPLNGGSSLNVTIARSRAELEAGIRAILAGGDSALVETFIPGRELTVGVLEDTALPVIEMRTARAFYDFTAKYQGNHTEYVFDTGLPADVYAEVQDLAVRAHRALGCRDCSRVDIRLDPAGKPFILELNAIPGMTEKSLLPKAAAEVGIPFPRLADRLVAAAMERYGCGY